MVYKDRITNRVCRGEIDSQAASSGAEQKDKYVRPETRNSPTDSVTIPRNDDISHFVCKLIWGAGI